MLFSRSKHTVMEEPIPVGTKKPLCPHPVPEVIPAAGPSPLSPPQLAGLLKAGETGDCNALLALGRHYDGIGSAGTECVRYYTLAAQAGSAEAAYQLGVFHIKGKYLKKDLQLAGPYLISAAAAGHANAMHLLALDYSLGGDGKNAFIWYDRAARLGVVRSQLALGDLYHTGYRGFVSPNNEASLYWYCRAYLQGNTDARDRLNKLIFTPKEFRGGIERVQAALAGIENGTLAAPEVRFIVSKKGKRS